MKVIPKSRVSPKITHEGVQTEKAESILSRVVRFPERLPSHEKYLKVFPVAKVPYGIKGRTLGWATSRLGHDIFTITYY